MELISIDGATPLKGMDEASIREFAENEATYVSAAISLGGGAREQDSLHANLERYFHTLSQQDADRFIATFEAAFSAHINARTAARIANYKNERRAQIKRALLFWGPVITAIALYFLFKH
jgi:hypothetical protein